MFYQNDVMKIHDCNYRVLCIERHLKRVWVINLEISGAFPECMEWSDVWEGQHVETEDISAFSNPTKARLAVRDKAWERIEPLTKNIPAIFHADVRGKLILERAKECGCTDRTLYHDLRKYWLGGQTAQALLGNYNNCGTSATGVTVSRGRPPTRGIRPIYQITERDQEHFQKIVKEHLLKSEVQTVRSAFKRLLWRFYTYKDGNGKEFVLELGYRPSPKQFAHFVKRNYPRSAIILGQQGRKKFEKDHRAVLSSVLDDCSGVGHQYEIDATIADVFLVSATNKNKIVGKPTLYFIVDRKSRLIVGFYLGLLNASWQTAVEALTSISTDKKTLCEYYGVVYAPGDWPAHQLFPKEFIADGGEMKSRASDELVRELGVKLSNVPSLRPDWKPLVENSFKLMHETLKDETPGYEPPSNVTKRRGKNYSIDATLSLRQFGKRLLEYIIMYNKKPMKSYPLSPQEIEDEVMPSPINLWNYGMTQDTACPQRRPTALVRNALLPREPVSVTQFGIKFRDLYYACDELIQRQWFVTARKKQFKVDVKFESGNVDKIYVLDKGEVIEATLTGDSKKFAGMSFAEYDYYRKRRENQSGLIQAARDQAEFELHEKSEPTLINAARVRRKTNDGSSRTAKRAGTKPARNLEIRIEQKELMGRALNDKLGGEGSSPIGLDHTTSIEENMFENGTKASTEDTALKPAASNIFLNGWRNRNA